MKRSSLLPSLALFSILLAATALHAQVVKRAPIVPPPPSVRPPNAVARTFKPMVANANLSGVESMTLSPDAVYAGQSTSVTVVLMSPAPAGGAKVVVSAAPATSVKLPASVDVPAGQTTATFLLPTVISAGGTVTISAALQGAPKPLTADLRVVAVPPTVSGFGFPEMVKLGSAVTGLVWLTVPAPAGGVTVTIYAVNPTDAVLPTTVTVPAGEEHAPMTIQTKQTPGLIKLYATQAEMQANSNSYTRVNVSAPPRLLPLQYCPSTRDYNCTRGATASADVGESIALHVEIDHSWPDALPVAFTTNQPQLISFDGSPGYTLGGTGIHGNVVLKSAFVMQPTAVTITATCAICLGTPMTAVLNVKPPVAVMSLTLAQTQLKGGTTATGTVTLNKAGYDPVKVTFTSTNPSICPAPLTVVIPAGQTSGSFTLAPQAVVSSAPITISAAVAGTPSLSKTVTITP